MRRTRSLRSLVSLAGPPVRHGCRQVRRRRHPGRSRTRTVRRTRSPSRPTRRRGFRSTCTRRARRIVFSLLGDLYLLPIGGGEATRITSGPAYDAQPRFSPDGKWIAFASDRGGIENLWVCDLDGKNARADLDREGQRRSTARRGRRTATTSSGASG